MKKLDIYSILMEGTMVTDRTGKTTYVANDIDNNTARTDPNIKSATTTQGRKLKEAELEEMARIPSKYRLTPEWRGKFIDLPEKAQKNKTVKFIIDYAEENPEWQILDIAKAYGEFKGDPRFARQQMFNPIIKDLLEPYGLVEPVSGDALTKPRKSFADEEDSVERALSDREAAGDAELAQYFDTSKSGETEEEPEIEPELPKSQYVAPTSAKSQAAEFFFKYDRILQKLINLQSQSRTKIRRSMNEIELKDDSFYNQESGRKENSLSKLDELVQEYVDLIQQEEPEVQRAIVEMLDYKLSNNYKNLYNKIVKTLGDIPYTPSSKIEDEFDIEDLEFDDEDIEEPLDESIIKQFKLRAGILK